MLLSLGSSQIVWALDASGDTSIPPILSWDYYNESYYGKDFVNNIILGSQSYNTINGSSNIILNSGGRESNCFNTVNGDSINIGKDIYTGNKSTGIGNYVFAGSDSVAIGYGIYDHKDVNGISYYNQDNIKPTGYLSVALGKEIEANGVSSIALGHSVKANGTNSIAIGEMAASVGEGSVAIGSDSYASGSVVSFGHQIGDNATTLGISQHPDVDANGKYKNTLTRRLVNVTDGINNSDAATKGQVISRATFSDNILTLARNNGKDNVTVDLSELVTDDSLFVKYTDNTKSAVDIGSASISTTGRGNFGSISVGGNTYIDDKGIDANSKVISNVAAAVKDSDAVNKKQMEDADDKILETSKVYTDTKIKNVTVDALREANDYTDMRFNNLDQKINKTGAATAAMAGLHPLDFDEEQKLNFAVATGGYHGSSAIALGMFYRPNEHVMFNLSGSTSGSEHMYSLGASFALDRSSGTHVSSRRALTEKVQQLSKVNEAVIKQSMELQAKNDELQSQIAELRQIVMEMKKSA